jgi:hypothetical protein
MNADGSGRTLLTAGDPSAGEPAWSPDGQKIVFTSNLNGGVDVWTMNSADGSGRAKVTNDIYTDLAPAWSPSGQQIAYRTTADTRIHVVNVDGTGGHQVSPTGQGEVEAPNWSPDGHVIAYKGEVLVGSVITPVIDIVNPDGTGAAQIPNSNNGMAPAWSPDRSKFVFGFNQISTINVDGTNRAQIASGPTYNPDWQPVPYTGYPRPKGATPLRVTLVPAHSACTSANTSHGAPLAFPSCSPPVQTSSNVTVGTPDANGAAANATGFIKFTAFAGVPGPPDESNIGVRSSITDVRCGAGATTCGAANANGGADYTGELRVEFDVRLTDRDNSPLTTATANDFSLGVSVQCNGTADTATGSTCTLNTNTAAFLGACFHDSKRAIFELRDVRVMDGGPDGDGDTTGDNSLFARPGLFVP